MKKLWWAILLAGSASAQQTTLTFQGTDTNMAGSATKTIVPCVTYVCMVAKLTLAEPLGRNLVNQGIVAYGASLQIGMDTLAGYGIAPSEWDAFFSTDSNGKIIGWSIFALFLDPNNPTWTSTLISSSAADFDTFPGTIYFSEKPGAWTQSIIVGPAPVTLKVLECSPSFKVIAPSNSIMSNVSQSSTGSPSLCALPSSTPKAYFIKTSANGGGSWQWTSTLGSLGLGK